MRKTLNEETAWVSYQSISLSNIPHPRGFSSSYFFIKQISHQMVFLAVCFLSNRCPQQMISSLNGFLIQRIPHPTISSSNGFPIKRILHQTSYFSRAIFFIFKIKFKLLINLVLFDKNDLSFFIFSKYNASTDSLICSFRTIWYQENGKMRIRRSKKRQIIFIEQN
jgi:hypothetical protein